MTGLSLRQELGPMRKPNPTPRPCGHVLHTDPDLYVLVRYTPRQDQPNYCRASCEAVDPDDPAKGNALVIYLSPFDAHLDAAFLSRPGEPFHAVHAAAFDPRELIRDHGGKLHYYLHFGWGASDGRLVVRRQGGLTSLYRGDTLVFPPANPNAFDLKIRAGDLAHYGSMRDRAGLYAYAEHYRAVLGLDERSRMQHVARAIENMPGRVPVGAEVNQMAIYDPEAAQWHFIPIDAFFQGRCKERGQA